MIASGWVMSDSAEWRGSRDAVKILDSHSVLLERLV
jgi:hypothetical protein